MISNAGSQTYQFGGGNLVTGSLLGHTLTTNHVHFELDATVNGLQSVAGKGYLVVTSSDGHDGGGGHSGGHANGGNGGQSDKAVLSAKISITGALPAAIFPITVTSPTSYANCDPSSQQCNSEIPLFFTGIATVVLDGGQDPQQIPIAIESPYWNPFGAQILITSLDSPTNPAIYLVVHYNRATIDWDGVQLLGEVTAGTFGTESITGQYGQMVNSEENLVSAMESDRGNIAFVGMSDPILNAQGKFSGHTTFTLSGSFDCVPEFDPYVFQFLGFHMPHGTCTATGATSNGSFRMNGGQNTLISGSYQTAWSVPSLFTVTIVIGAVTQH